MAVRLDYEASCKRLHELGWPDSEPAPPVPERKPRYDDDETLGASFFRTRVVGDLSGLGTILTRRLGKTLALSGSQLSEINWTDDDGEEPVGG